MTDRTDIHSGLTLNGRYRLERELGRGGMGRVFRAHDLELDDAVALKLLSSAGEEDAQLRFRREVRLARRVTHPNVARVYDVGSFRGALFLTMELITGESLAQLLGRRAPLTWTEVAEIGAQVASGLAAAHRAGVAHRDLKPANILLDGIRAALTDFGVARSLTGEIDPLRTEGIVGTLRYMAPEQRAGARGDELTDSYALGLVLLESLTAAAPGGDARWPDVADLDQAPGLPAALKQIVIDLLELRPEDRPRAEPVARQLASLAPRGAGEMTSVTVADSPSARHGDPELRRASAASRLPRGRRPFAPLAEAACTLAVFPFRSSGAEPALAEAISEELTDILAHIRGYRVVANGAARRFGPDPDPREAGQALGADSAIFGAVSCHGDSVRIRSRLVDVTSGIQLWSDTFSAPIGESGDACAAVAQRVAEALRVRIAALGPRGSIPPEAAEQYLRARRAIRRRWLLESDGAVAALDRCLSVAPDFLPAVAAHALGSVWAWMVSPPDRRDAYWQRAQSSCDRALDRAHHLPETHVAQGLKSAQSGDYRESAAALARALDIAPTCADAHEYLGRLQLEAGSCQEGEVRLALAASLDPESVLARVDLARHFLLRGDVSRARAWMDEAGRVGGDNDIAVLVLRARFAAWTGDANMAKEVEELACQLAGPMPELLGVYARAALGQADPAALERAARRALAGRTPRLACLAHQLAAEACALAGAPDAARAHLDAASETVLADLAWLDRCPVLEPVREGRGFEAIRRAVRARANWSEAPSD